MSGKNNFERKKNSWECDFEYVFPRANQPIE